MYFIEYLVNIQYKKSQTITGTDLRDKKRRGGRGKLRQVNLSQKGWKYCNLMLAEVMIFLLLVECCFKESSLSKIK